MKISIVNEENYYRCMSSNLFRFGSKRSNCSDGEPSNKRKKDGEGSIQTSESSTQSEGSDKATSSSSYERKCEQISFRILSSFIP